MPLTRPTTQAGHRAALHPRLARATEAGIAEYVRRHPTRERPVYISTRRPQLDCRTVRGVCARNSLHSMDPARAADIDTPTDWGKESDPKGYAREFAGYVRAADPCVQWHGPGDYPHFQLPLVCAASATVETAVVSAATGVPHAVAQAVDALAARMGVPAWTLYLGGGIALASLLASASNRL